ncbi:MAG: tetratricopeptide repeat protein, partial [Aggregatilineales bacterium]
MTIIVIPLLLLTIAGGVLIYQSADDIRPVVMEQIDSVIAGVESGMATVNAPTAIPTVNPVNILVNADNFWDAGSVNEALSLYIDVLPSVPNDATVYTRVVTGLIGTGEVSRALIFAEDAVTADPYSSDAWAARAWTLDWSGDAGGAIVSALHAEALDPQNDRAIAWLAEAYLSAEQVQRALDTANRAIELNPDSAEAYRARGYVNWLGLFDTVTALNDLETAFEIAIVNNPSMLGLIAVDIAQLSIGNQDVDDAIVVLERVLELNPENTSALYWMGSIYFGNLGDPSQASTYVTRCVEVNPDSVNCNYLLGRTQDRLEQPEAAAQSFIQAVNLGSQVSRHWWWAA